VDEPPPRKEPPPPPGPTGPFPRRALAVSVNEYWLANPLNYGKSAEKGFPGSSTAAVLRGLGNFHLKFPNTQLVELSDQGQSPHPPVKAVIERTITDFLQTSRGQDRVVLLFAGQAVEIGKEAYLVPLLGNLKKAETLIPLTWVYDRLKECKARQKLLILDVCRYDPGRGRERPGSDPMGKVLDAKLQAPPEGVQVWASCVAGQQSYETESGSVFLQALCAAMQERLPGFQEPGATLPLETLVPRVNQQVAKHVAPVKVQQTPRLAGREADGGATYNPDEPPAQVVSIRPAPVPGGDVAGAALVRQIVDEMLQVPPPRVGRPGVQDAFNLKILPPFPARSLEPYRADSSKSWLEFENKAEEYPLRAAVVRTVKALQKNAHTFAMKEYFAGATSTAVKKAVLKEQAAPGKAILFLKEALEDLEAAGKDRKKEKSKRWQADYDFVMARLKGRLIYLMEYDFLLAQIRTDSLPSLAEGDSGYRVGTSNKVTVTESEARTWSREVTRLWQKLIDENPDTPWSLMAQREQLTVLGLQWRPSRE
jgi:hypothetical protein